MSGQANVAIRSKQWACSVMSTPGELSAGLSGVPSLPAGEGMLFDLGSERTVTVNAYDMLFPLTVVFINGELKVTEAVLTLVPGGDVTTELPCRYFLEVNAGEIDDIELGDSVTITGYTPTTGGGIDISSMMNLMVTMMIVTMMMKMMMGIMKEVK